MDRAQREQFERFLAASVPLRNWWGMRLRMRAMDRGVAIDRALQARALANWEEEPLLTRQLRELGW